MKAILVELRLVYCRCQYKKIFCDSRVIRNMGNFIKRIHIIICVACEKPQEFVSPIGIEVFV